MAEVNTTALGIDALLVLQRSDVNHLATEPERWAGVPLLFIDPGTMDAAIQAGFGHYALRRLQLDRDLPARVYSEALTRASALDQALTRERRALWSTGPGDHTPYSGWDQMLLYMSLQRAFMARALGECVAAQFPEGRLGLLRPDPAQLMNFDGMLSAEMAAVDPQRFVFVGRYEAVRFHDAQMTRLAWHTEGLRQCVLEQGGVDGVAHIPTCFYDARTFAEQIRAAHPRLLDLPGTYCDIALSPRRPQFMRVADTPANTFEGSPLRYRERALAVYREHLAGWMPSRAALEQQAQLWAERSHQQALNHLGLVRALEGQTPRFIVADHDTGQNGPIYSAAARLGSPITVLPHSGYATSMLPHARQVTAVESVGFGAAVRSVLGQPITVRPVRYRAVPPAPPARPAARRVCLLLNTMLSEGISHVDFFPLVAFYKRLAVLCTAHGAELQVRLKPSTPALTVVAAAFGQPAAWFQQAFAKPIAQAADEADLAIAYGEPTSGIASFLDADSLVLHVSEQDWPADTLITPPYMRDGLLPSLHGDAALAEVHRLLADAALYQARQQRQSQAYAARTAGAFATLFD